MTAILDAGALIALERGDRRMLALAMVIVREEIPALVPASVLAQVWRGSARQHPIARLLATTALRVDPMDEGTAKAIGLILAASSTADVVDGHVALLGRRTKGTVYATDPHDIERIDSTIKVVAI